MSSSGETCHRVSHEESGTDQPSADSADQPWDHARRGGPSRGPGKAACRDAVERAGKHEVCSLQPACATGREGTHGVAPPFISRAARSDRGEAAHEERAGNDPARDLCRHRQRLALNRGHGGHGIETRRWPTDTNRRRASGAGHVDFRCGSLAGSRQRASIAGISRCRNSKKASDSASRRPASVVGPAKIGSIVVLPSGGDDAAQQTADALAAKLGGQIVTADPPVADLIVVGSQAGTPPGRLALSGAARTMLDASRGSVLVVPSGKPVQF